MRWKSWDATFHRLSKEEKQFLGDLIDHWLEEKEYMLETAENDDIFITNVDDLIKVSGSIYHNEMLARALLKEFRYD